MKHLYIAGNWKSNKTVTEADAWFKAFAPLVVNQKDVLVNITTIVCGPFTDLFVMKKLTDELSLPVELGAQDISPFTDGAYTGEESARMIKDLVSWVIIGHSERRKYMHEDNSELFAETTRAKEAGLKVIYCVPDDQTDIPPNADMIGYEPVWAIGTGKTDTPENANQVISNIKAKYHIEKAVYGGSITADNVALFTAMPAIDGVLVGGASLDPQKFYTLMQKAISIVS